MRPGDFIDYYEILGLPSNATDDDVREAWRRAARLYHPDLNPRKTSFRFRRAKEAYDVLVDPARRRDYDRLYRLRKGVFSRSAGNRRSSGTVVGTPPGSRTPPGSSTRPTNRTGPGGARPAGASPSRPRPPEDATRAAGSGSAAPSAGSKSSGSAAGSTTPGTTSQKAPQGGPSTAAPSSPRKTGPVTGAKPGPGSSDVRTRTSFRPATVFREAKGSSLLDQLKDAVTQGGASRIALRHNGKVVWETHVTSSLLDDITNWLVGPVTAVIRLLGAEAQFQVEVTNELVEDYNQGNELYDGGKLEDAKASYKRCVERDKYFAPAHLSLGAVYEAQQDIPVAIKCYQNTVKIDPTGEAGRFARENLRRLRGY